MFAAFINRHNLALAALFLLIAFLLAWATFATVAGMVEDAREQAVSERDAHWAAEIERSNAFAAREIAAQAKTALAIEADANARVRAAEDKLTELEKQNAALPDGDACGIGRARVRLLNR